jgi:FkbM family methyltransferase
MVKTIAKRTVELMPGPLQKRVRSSYWSLKSNLLYRHLYRLLNLENTLRSGLTLKVASKGEWWTYNDIYVNGEYDLPIQTAVGSCSRTRPFTVVDLGANVGYFALRVVDLLRRNGLGAVPFRITMVEGSPRTFRELEQRMQCQNLPPGTVRLIQGLVGRRAGTGRLHESAVHVKNTIISGGNGGGTAVNFVDLSSLLKEESVIDLLKCDIEGAELLFLENYGDLFPKVKNAVFELHHRQCDTTKCLSLLHDMGFQQQVLRDTDSFSVSFFRRA